MMSVLKSLFLSCTVVKIAKLHLPISRHHPVLRVLCGHGVCPGVLAAGGAQGGHRPGGGGLQASSQLPHSGEIQVRTQNFDLDKII